jgi:hypothetical protein
MTTTGCEPMLGAGDKLTGNEPTLRKTKHTKCPQCDGIGFVYEAGYTEYLGPQMEPDTAWCVLCGYEWMQTTWFQGPEHPNQIAMWREYMQGASRFEGDGSANQDVLKRSADVR